MNLLAKTRRLLPCTLVCYIYSQGDSWIVVGDPLKAVRIKDQNTEQNTGPLCGGPGQKSQDYSTSDPEGTLKHWIKIAHTRWDPL